MEEVWLHDVGHSYGLGHDNSVFPSEMNAAAKGRDSSSGLEQRTSRAARVAATTSTTVLGLGLTYVASITSLLAVANKREQCLDHDPNFCGDRHAGAITGVLLGPFLIGMGVDLVGDRLDGRGGMGWTVAGSALGMVPGLVLTGIGHRVNDRLMEISLVGITGLGASLGAVIAYELSHEAAVRAERANSSSLSWIPALRVSARGQGGEVLVRGRF